MIRRCTLTVVAAMIGGGMAAAAEGTYRPADLAAVTWLEQPRHEPVELVRDGTPRAVVYVAAGRERNAAGAATAAPPPFLKEFVGELVECIRLATGATLDVVDQPPAADRPAIVIGDCAESRAAGVDAATLAFEGFVVRTAPGRVYLVGSTRTLPVNKPNGGVAWAVADFLERIVGVRWYWPTNFGGRSVPRRQTLAIEPAHYRDQPVFPLRQMYQDWWFMQPRSRDEALLPFDRGLFPKADKTLWLGNHMLRVRSADALPYDRIMQGARVFEYGGNLPREPEAMFQLAADGSRSRIAFCLSAPETMRFYLDGMQRAWGGGGKGPRPGGITASGISIWSPGTAGWESLAGGCRCDRCRAKVARDGEAGLVGGFLQALCVAVKERWPDKQVIYAPFTLPECPEGLTFPDNLVINSLDVGTLGLWQQPEERAVAERRIRDWRAAAGRKVGLWVEYQSPSDWTCGPVQFPHLARDFFAGQRDTIDGAQALTYGAACHITAAPTAYVWMRSLWNPDLDVDATLDEMCRRLFGAGAGPARELLRLQCDRWQRLPSDLRLRVGENRIPAAAFRQIWPADVVGRMKELRDTAIEAIEKAADADARRSFHYWTWTFDEFTRESRRIEAAREPDPPGVAAVEPAAERFAGGDATATIAQVGPVRREDAPAAGQSTLRFGLRSGNAWRAGWTEPAATSATGRDEPVESWSAVWVFAKFRRPDGDGYGHATLAAERSDHTVPASAALDVGLTDGAGKGVFIYRSAPGHGPWELADVGLRWLHAADGVEDPQGTDLRVFAIDMVRVPAGAFHAGSGGGEPGAFGAGGDGGGEDANNRVGRPFLIDVGWSGPAAAGTPARRLGQLPGCLWSRDGVAIEADAVLDDAFPTGHGPFYCMRYELTRGQFTDYLNTLPAVEFADTAAGDEGHAARHATAAGRYGLTGSRPRLVPRKPHQACNLLSWWDGAKYASWAALRPLTELEYEKACRGPRRAVAEEYAWGSATIAKDAYTVADEGAAGERIAAGAAAGVGNASHELTLPAFFGGPVSPYINGVPGGPMRPGIFATATSGRFSSGGSYWGIMELSGNLREQVVSLADAQGRAYRGSHGDGTTTPPADWPAAGFRKRDPKDPGKQDGQGSGVRGGFYGDFPEALRVSDRSRSRFSPRQSDFSPQCRPDQNGWRCGRTAP